MAIAVPMHDFTAKIEHIVRHRELFPDFAATGCAFVVSAVESLSEVVLARLEKGHTRADVQVALDVLRRAGIALRPSFVPFTPWATIGDYLELLDWVTSEEMVDQVDPVQFAIRRGSPRRGFAERSQPRASWALSSEKQRAGTKHPCQLPDRFAG